MDGNSTSGGHGSLTSTPANLPEITFVNSAITTLLRVKEFLWASILWLATRKSISTAIESVKFVQTIPIPPDLEALGFVDESKRLIEELPKRAETLMEGLTIFQNNGFEHPFAWWWYGRDGKKVRLDGQDSGQEQLDRRDGGQEELDILLDEVARVLQAYHELEAAKLSFLISDILKGRVPSTGVPPTDTAPASDSPPTDVVPTDTTLAVSAPGRIQVNFGKVDGRVGGGPASDVHL